MQRAIIPPIRSLTLPLFASLASLALAGCAGQAARPDSGFPEDLSFHRSVRSQAYLHAFSQEAVPVPERSEAGISVAALVANQPRGATRTFAQIAISARPQQPADASQGNVCLRNAILAISPSTGFTLVRLCGADSIEAAQDRWVARLGDIKTGETRILIAELERTADSGNVRVLGANLQGIRTSDGLLFETVEGTKMDWHLGGPAKLNKQVARNSLVCADAEALQAIGVLAERGDAESLAQALTLASQQLNTLKALGPLDRKGLESERERFASVQGRLQTKWKERFGDREIPAAATGGEGSPERALALATQSPPGPGAALAKFVGLPLD